MSSSPSDQPSLSPADRIRELSAINADISSLLQSAGHAIQALTGAVPADSDENDVRMSDSESPPGQDSAQTPQQAAFTRHTKAYFITLQAICARLNRQAIALEEAGIVAPETTLAGAAETVKNGGLGNFDVGWLNSRSNKLGAEKEREIMREARALVEELVRESEAEGVGKAED